MKPFNYEGVAELAQGMKGVVTAEEHSYIGGLAAATALALRRSSVPMDYRGHERHLRRIGAQARGPADGLRPDGGRTSPAKAQEYLLK